MNFEYVIVQAGGKGTRLLPLTKNKPKSLVPVNNRPILFHLFQKYSNKKFIIIGDYKFDVLARYLELYAPVDYMLVHANGNGNMTGLDRAMSFIPDQSAFMVIWADLLLSDDFTADDLEDGYYVGVTDQFPCSWSFEQGKLDKHTSDVNGLAGCFLFKDKKYFENMPSEGSFATFLQQSEMPLKGFSVGMSKEVGTLKALNSVDSKENRCRPYNKITISGEKVVKEGLTEEAKKLINKEVQWYQAVAERGFKGIPEVYSLEPLTIARIHGDNIFKVELDDDSKKKVIDNLCLRLNEMHNLQCGQVNYFDMQEDYYTKTMKRLRGIQSVIPFFNKEEIMINGVLCKNVLCHPEFLQTKVDTILSDSKFGIIHGDCTLTNTLIHQDKNMYVIDARGYFWAHTVSWRCLL